MSLKPRFAREIVTAPLTRKDAEKLQGTVFDGTGRPLTIEEILADTSTSKVTHSRNIVTGKMELADEHHNHSGIPFFVMKVGR